MGGLINNIDVYRRIALNCLESYTDCEKRIEQCKKHSLSMGPDGMEFRYQLETKKYEFAVQSIIFSALSLEAFVNDFLLENLGKSNFEALDKLEVKAKILIGTKMIIGKEFPKDMVAYQKLSKLISIRNKLVHAKSVNVDSDVAKILIEIEKKDIEEATLTYQSVIEEIDKLNPGLGIKDKYLLSDERLRNWYYLHA